MAHDGDNAWGGGSSYYSESVPGLMNAAASRGYRPTTIQQFLAEHPVPVSDYVHVEDGAWVNAANDWGHPQFVNWLWPPTRAPNDPARISSDPRTWYDLETPGWSEDWRNWAVIIAGANYCETAEQITRETGSCVLSWKIQEPVQRNGINNNPNAAEQAWHYYLAGLDSGFMYYGTALDDEVKPTLACNRAIAFAEQVINAHPELDRTPPTVFKPQRFPWNPGGAGWGPLTGYRPVGLDGYPPYSSDFYVWTHVFDVSSVATVTLFVREDEDGINPLSDDANETYAGGPGVGVWVALPMTRRSVPKENVTGNPEISFFIEPRAIADYYFARVRGYRDRLLDYYVEAVDARGNVHKTDIQHVYVGDDGTAQEPVSFSPDPRDNAPLVITYRSAGRPLEAVAPVRLHLSFDGGNTWAEFTMNGQIGSNWISTNAVPPCAPNATVWFSDLSRSIVDDNAGVYWSIAIRHVEPEPPPLGAAAVSFDPPNPSNGVPVRITYMPNDGVLKSAAQVYIHIGRNGWNDILIPDPAMTPTGANWVYTYMPPLNTYQINCCFNDGNTWDTRGGANWNIAVAGTTGAGMATIAAVAGSPVILPPPSSGQNNVGESFDLNRAGGYAATCDQGGFGSFGQIYINYDSTNFYIGGVGCDLAGGSNAMLIFLGFNTLADDAYTLWEISGPPRGLDILHNFMFDQPMDIAIVLGDEYGDGTFTNFYLADGYDFGQGCFYLSASGRFVPVAGARLTQFDGAGTAATLTTDDDGERLMNRWKAAIPWTSLAAPSGLVSITECWLAGLVVSSSTNGNDRYISGNYLGAGASETLTDNNYGFNFVELQVLAVTLPPPDSDGDGIPDEWELQHCGRLDAMDGRTDTDEDGFPDIAEFRAGTDPVNAASLLRIRSLTTDAKGSILRWESVAGKRYDLYQTTNLLSPAVPLVTAIPATPPTNIFADALGPGPARFYQVRLGL